MHCFTLKQHLTSVFVHVRRLHHSHKSDKLNPQSTEEQGFLGHLWLCGAGWGIGLESECLGGGLSGVSLFSSV